MNILSWNCRGLGNPSAVLALCELVRVHRPNVIFLFETIARMNKIEELRVRLNYDCCFAVDCVGRSGGICVFWKSTSLCSLLSYSRHHLDLIISGSGGDWRLTGYYGYPERDKRQLSWSLLRHLARQNDLPWLCVGDYNDLLSPNDKRGRVPHPDWLFAGFRSAILDSNLMDIDLEGHKFTWSRGNGTTDLIEERLDRAMGNPAWHAFFPNAKLKNLVAAVSDHNPILVITNPVTRRCRSRSFRFENKWLEEPDIQYIVDRSWKGFSDFDLLKRLDAMGETLRTWGDHVARAWHLNKKELENELMLLQKNLTASNLVRYGEVRKSLATLLLKEEIHWRQRSKILWLKGGDLNTKFFHQTATSRRKTNTIKGLMNVNGDWVTNQVELEGEIRSYFEDLFTAERNVGQIEEVTNCINSRISEADNDYLCKEFEKSEFRKAIFQMHKDKSPGPDGFNPGFFQKFWSTIGEDLTTACISWLETGSLPEGLNHTNVVLIPKVAEPKSVKDLRPISLCNVVYKIISKVLSNRLKIVLPEIVDETQAAFVAGRSIQDNIVIAFETLHSMKNKRRGKNGDVAVKIDISKAYDRVDWNFLDSVLKKLGFCDKWLNWMRLCVHSVTYSFYVNDTLVGPIRPGRGLRQGDPLSPYLFILCAQGLSSLLQNENRRGRLHGSRVCRRAPSISHLLFADDSLLFCRATLEESTSLKHALNLYERASGQAINYSKSGVFFSANVSENDRQEICDILEVHGTIDTGRYLGLPSLIGRGRKQVFQSIKDRLWKKIQGWRSKKISKAGKEVLLKAAAQAVPAYSMSTFLLPSTLVDELQRMMNSYWWGHGTDPSKGIKWETWDSLCKHKFKGGMGFKNLHLFNIALLGKLGWSLLTKPGNLVNRILKAKYFPHVDFFDAAIGSNPSQIWRGIYEARDLVRKGTRWKIGDGTTVQIWGDKWLNRDENFQIASTPIHGFEDMKVADLFVPGTNSWDVSLITEVFDESERSAILNTTPSPMGFPDKRIWHHSPDGRYSVKSAYHLAMSLVYEENNMENKNWKLLWSMKLPPKIKNFYWRLCKGWLAVKSKLVRRGVGGSALCPVCGQEPETIWHLMVRCSFAKDCWALTNLKDLFENSLDNANGSDELFQGFLLHKNEVEKERLLMVAWQIWNHRNGIVWRSESLTPAVVVHKALVFMHSWKEAQNSDGTAEVPVQCKKWHAPAAGCVKINVDASFCSESARTGIGMLIRDEKGHLLAGKTLWKPGIMKVEEGEAWGLWEAVVWIQEMGFNRAVVEVDAKRVTDAIKSEDVADTPFGDYIKLIKSILSISPLISVKLVNRNANCVAHAFARNSRFFESPHTWVEPPTFVDGLLDVVCSSCV